MPSPAKPGRASLGLKAFRKTLTLYVALAGVACLLLPLVARADATYLYAVQLSATIQTSPPQIVLQWPPDQYGSASYEVFRKLKDDTSWGNSTGLPGSATSFTDNNVAIGGAYEYQVIKHASLGYTGFGYIYAGIQAPMIENRGKIVLIVSADSASLASELSRLQSDLAGDGWVVLRHDVSSTATPDAVKALIVSDYFSDPSQVKAVLLFGRVPVVMCGSLNYDGHGGRPMPADAYYGDMDGNWHLELDPGSRPNFMPTDIELMVGRVDFQNMPGAGAPTPWPSETELLRQYLQKDHAYRHKIISVPRRAIMANRIGDYGGLAYAATGYRNFQPFVGPGNIVEAGVADLSLLQDRWVTLVGNGPYLWSYGCGGGQDVGISELGSHGLYNDVYSTDIVAADAKAVFNMFYGSHMGEWSVQDNVMRSALATHTYGLTACLAGSPHWFVHHMSLGETIGYGTRITMNNTSFYQNQYNSGVRAIYISLLGDPTLRLDPVAPASNLRASASNGSATLLWNGSPDGNIVGYHIYRAATPAGPFTRLTSSPVTGGSYVDSSGFASSTRTYQVRAIALEANPSGSYYDPSQGVFATLDVSGTPPPVTNRPPVRVKGKITPGGVQLTWNTVPGSSYRVQGMVLVYNNDWVDLSGHLTATSTNTTFTDSNWVWYWSRFYRVISE